MSSSWSNEAFRAAEESYSPFDAWMNDSGEGSVQLQLQLQLQEEEQQEQQEEVFQDNVDWNGLDWFSNDEGSSTSMPSFLNEVNDNPSNNFNSNPPIVLDENSSNSFQYKSIEENDNRQKTIKFAEVIATPLGPATTEGLHDSGNNWTDSNSSLTSLDIFGDKPGSAKSLGSVPEDESDKESSVDAEKEKEKQIKKQMAWSAATMGGLAFFGWAAQKIMSRMSQNDDIDGGMDITNGVDAMTNANDVAALASGGDGGATQALAMQATTDAATQASFHASASASQSQLGIGLAGVGNNAGATSGMSAAQVNVMQTMAVNAASNAASSATAASSAISTAAAGAAGATAAAGTVATTTTIATAVVSNRTTYT